MNSNNYEWRRVKFAISLDCNEDLEPGDHPKKLNVKAGTLLKVVLCPQGGLSRTSRNGKEWTLSPGSYQSGTEMVTPNSEFFEYRTDVIRDGACQDVEDQIKGLSLNDHMDCRGLEGWELVQVMRDNGRDQFLFKRRRPAPRNATSVETAT